MVASGPQYQTQNTAVSTQKSRDYSANNRYRQSLLQQKSSSLATKRKDRQMGLHEIKKLLHNKRNGL
jgi:hypothetical protein